MSLFGKKKEEQSACSCNGSCESMETKSVKTEGKLNIKVLGAGCKSCHQQYENVKEAISTRGIDAEVEYITDMEKVMSYGVMSMPAVVVNEQVVSMGKMLKKAEFERLVEEYMRS